MNSTTIDITQKDFQNETTSSNQKVDTYVNGTPIFLDRTKFNESIFDYLSNIAAVDLISTKNIDALVVESEKFSKDKSKEFNLFLKEQFLEKKIYQLAKDVALNGASCLFLHPTFNQSEYKYSLNPNCSILRLMRINNEIKACEVLVKFMDGIATTPIFALVRCDANKYETTFYSNNQIKGNKVKTNEKPIAKDELKIWFEDNDLANDIYNSLNQEHNLGFVPIFVLSITENMSPLIRNIDNDMDELFELASKMYDEAHFMGTKVKSINSGMSDNDFNNEESIRAQKIMASSSILHANNLLDENGEPQMDVITKTPIWQMLNDAFKQKINFILKKIGISSDTDSKGTVQQSIGEVIKQNEYSYNNQNYRNLILQNFLQDMLSKVYKANFNTTDEVRVISSQSLGMSEMEKLNYVIMAKTNNLMDEARAMSVLSGKNYIESLELLELFNLNFSPEQEHDHNELASEQYQDNELVDDSGQEEPKKEQEDESL